VRTFTQSDVPRLLEALRPMLRTLLGHAISDDILESLARELSP
jgi:hypothetical protein